MKVTRYKTEEDEFEDLPDEDQLAYIKNELFEIASRVVIAVGLGLGGLWYGFTTTPHSFVSHSGGEVVHVTTSHIVFATLGLLAVSAWVGYGAYKRRERILNAIQAIQSHHARDDDE